MRILLVGHGKMGRLVESLAPEYGGAIAGIVDPAAGGEEIASERVRALHGLDVAIDFSSPEAVVANVAALAGRRVNIVLGTTGWGAREDELRRLVTDAGIGIVAAPNFAAGAVLFEALVAEAARRFAAQTDFGAYVHEVHHAAKKDAPSGTALLLERAMRQAGFARPIDVSSARVGFVPGIHTVGFDGPAETITLTHSARDRSAFARGALVAAKWIQGKSGWFTMKDVLGVQA
jgi:4-hydroxy-tetrahydrodipicolinate reductase